uniref:Uncharacterized protein n=1 Tax=Rhizophora mucronata TaxID=61149 RepID=A0A2P2PUX1_RHIMU
MIKTILSCPSKSHEYLQLVPPMKIILYILTHRAKARRIIILSSKSLALLL